MIYGEALGKGREVPEEPQVPLRWAMRSALTHRFSSKLNHGGAAWEGQHTYPWACSRMEDGKEPVMKENPPRVNSRGLQV